jgi:hypothetical protein
MVMQGTAKSKITFLIRQFGKHLVVANPKLGDQFLDGASIISCDIFSSLIIVLSHDHLYVSQYFP